MKLTKQQTKLHDEAEALLSLERPLTHDERLKVFDQWTPMANQNVGKGGIYFTPYDLATEVVCFGLENGRVIDLCAGIGVLSYAFYLRTKLYPTRPKIVAVEQNSQFVEIGRRLVPEVEWVRGDVFDRSLLQSLGVFDHALSNPPFGQVPSKTDGDWLAYKGPADLMVAEVALRIAREGAVMILPSGSVSFRDGDAKLPQQLTQPYKRFVDVMPKGLMMDWPGILTPQYKDKWNGASPSVEVVDLGWDVSFDYDFPHPLGLDWQPTKPKKSTVQPTYLEAL